MRSSRSHPLAARAAPLAVMIAVVLVASGGCSDRADHGRTGPSGTTAQEYAREPTTGCLERGGAVVSDLRPSDPRLQALRDLAQRDSLEVTFGGQSVGLAFVPDAAAAELLVELLEVPDDPYRVTNDRNVVLMYKPSAAQAFRLATGCLRS